MTLFCVNDTPTKDTGFGRVGKNLIPSFSKFFEKTVVWGLGYNPNQGFHTYPFEILPANPNSDSWRGNGNLQKFYHALMSLPDPVVLWAHNDPFRLASLIPSIEGARRNGKAIYVVSYLPIDGELNSEDKQWIDYIDLPVCYTEFGRKEVKKISGKDSLVLGLGTDKEFKTLARKNLLRKEIFPTLTEDDFLITNVNTNTPRKAPYHTLHIFSEMCKKDPSLKLYMHMNPVSTYNLRNVAEKLEIPYDSILFADPLFPEGVPTCQTDLLNKIYNTSDLYLSTTLAEGWGLGATEATMCGCPVAVPNHTSLGEIFDDETAIMLPIQKEQSLIVYSDNDRIRHPVDIKQSSELIYSEIQAGNLKSRQEKAYEKISKITWDEQIKTWKHIFSSIKQQIGKRNGQ